MKTKMSGKFLAIVVMSFIFVSVPEIPLLAEAVFLKDGSIIDGTIISDGASSVTLRLPEKKQSRSSETI